jgi:hypothetical protein
MTLVGPNLALPIAGGSAPNQLPGNWFVVSTNIGTVALTYAYGTEDSIPYIDFIMTGTPGAGGTFEAYYGIIPGFPLNVIPSTMYYHAANVRLAAGTWTNTVPNLVNQEHNLTTGFIRGDQFYVPLTTTGTLGPNRYSGSLRTAANCNGMKGTFLITFAAATGVSLTIRFGAPTIMMDDGLQLGGQRVIGWY